MMWIARFAGGGVRPLVVERDGVAREARLRSGQQPVLAQQAVDQRRFARVRAPDDSQPQGRGGHFLERRLGGGLRFDFVCPFFEMPDLGPQRVEQVRRTAMLGRHGHRIAEAERKASYMPASPARSALLATTTIGTSTMRSQRPISSSSGVSPARASITNSAASAPSRLTSVCARMRPGRPGVLVLPPGGVDHRELHACQFGIAHPPVARHAGLVVDQRELLAHEPVEQRRLADIGATDDDGRLGSWAGGHGGGASGRLLRAWQARAWQTWLIRVNRMSQRARKDVRRISCAHETQRFALHHPARTRRNRSAVGPARVGNKQGISRRGAGRTARLSAMRTYARQVSGIGSTATRIPGGSRRPAVTSVATPKVGAVMAFVPHRNMQLGHVAAVSRIADPHRAARSCELVAHQRSARADRARCDGGRCRRTTTGAWCASGMRRCRHSARRRGRFTVSSMATGPYGRTRFRPPEWLWRESRRKASSARSPVSDRSNANRSTGRRPPLRKRILRAAGPIEKHRRSRRPHLRPGAIRMQAC